MHIALRSSLVAFALAATVVSGCKKEPPPETATWSSNATAHRAAPAMSTFRYSCPPGGSAGTVYGTDVYSDDSSVCTAAVHAGKITLASGGVVTIETRGAQPVFTGTARNGVTSTNWATWPGSFVFR